MTSIPDLSRLASSLPAAFAPGEGVAGFAVDGLVPSLVVRPQSQMDAAATLGAAAEAGAAVVPFGGGSQQWLGMPPERYDVALDLRDIDALVEHEPADLTVTAEAGMRLSTLQRLLAEKGQWLPLDPPLSVDATIGGVLATNASGPARIGRGTARDLVIGMTVATPHGELVKSGGRVVKNVAGYDLAKLHIGALGTTGVITQVSFKVAPLPTREACVAVSGRLDSLLRLSSAVEEARLPLTGAALAGAPGDPIWRLALRFGSGDRAVERSLRETGVLAAAAGLSAEDIDGPEWRKLLPNYGAGVVVKASVLPERLSHVAGMLSFSGATVSALPGVGIAHGAWNGDAQPEMLQSLRAACEETGGALVLEKAPPATKRAVDVWGAPRADFALMQRVKQELDPLRALNPGRFVGGI